MKIPIFMIFKFFGIISAWAAKALEDGKISAAEGLELVTALGGALGVQVEFDVSDYLKPIQMFDPDGEPELPIDTNIESPPSIKPEE